MMGRITLEEMRTLMFCGSKTITARWYGVPIAAVPGPYQGRD